MPTDKMIEILEELLIWTKVTSFKEVKRTLEEALSKSQDRLVYSLCDGNRSGMQISQESGVSNVTISTLQSSWLKIGLVGKEKAGYKKRFSLEDFGLEIPTLAELKASKEGRRGGQK